MREQLDKFTDVLRVGMVSTYSRGLLAFGGYGVELGDTDFSPNSSRVASVTQLVSGEDGKVYTVKYQMGQVKDALKLYRGVFRLMPTPPAPVRLADASQQAGPPGSVATDAAAATKEATDAQKRAADDQTKWSALMTDGTETRAS